MTESQPFCSLGPSEFINAVRRELHQAANRNFWEIGGDSSLFAVYRPSNDVVDGAVGRGLKTQIWMERPQNGHGRCKFEVAGSLAGVDAGTNKTRREAVAASMRSRMAELGRPKEVEFANGSTVAAVRMILPRIKEARDDTLANASHYQHELAKVRVFVQFLETALHGWTYPGS